MTIEFTGIEAFLAVAETGSFTRAAKLLGISQPAISRRIEALEQSLRSPLFDRLPSGSRLAPAGRALIPYARQMRAARHDAELAVANLRDGSVRNLTLGIVGTLAGANLRDQIAAFRNQFPDVRLRLQTARSIEISERVASGVCDLGLRYFPSDGDDLIDEQIGTEKLVLISAPDAIQTDSTTIINLHGATWITFPLQQPSSGEAFARILGDLWQRNNFRPADVIEIDGLTAQKRLIEAGFGIGLVPISGITEELRTGSLVILNAPGFAAEAPIFLVRRRNGFLGLAMTALIRALGGNPTPS